MVQIDSLVYISKKVCLLDHPDQKHKPQMKNHHFSQNLIFLSKQAYDNDERKKNDGSSLNRIQSLQSTITRKIEK